MSFATPPDEFDLGPLSWVKGEIDLALERAANAIATHSETGDSTQLRYARTHLHQAHGALAMVGLSGLPTLTESLESLLLAAEEGRISGITGIACDALRDLRSYLDALMGGAPHQPLRLLSAHLAIAAAQDDGRAHPADLFHPDLGRLPARKAPPSTDDPDARRTLLKKERLNFQKALLTWLRQPEHSALALANLHDTLARIEAAFPTPAERAFWWVATAFVDSLGDPQVIGDRRARQLCSHIDTQLRRQIESGSLAPDRLMRELLYFVAHAESGHLPVLADVQAHYALAAQLPDPLSAPLSPLDGALRHLRETLLQCEDAWARTCATPGSHDPAFTALAQAVAECTADIGQTDLRRLGGSFAALANWLAADPARHNDSVAMEIATAILLLQQAQESFHQPAANFAAQVDAMVARLHACMAGQSPDEGGLVVLEDLTRRAQEKMLISQVSREMRSNLAQVEQSLDSYFRQPDDQSPLGPVDTLLRQIAGALAMLGHLPAVRHLQHCQACIADFAGAEDSERFVQVADDLSLLGFFVEALPQGERDFTLFAERLRGAHAEPAPPEVPSAPPTDAASDGLPDDLPLAPADIPPPSAATLQLAEADHADVDAELLSIFLDEANTVLATFREHLALLQDIPRDATALATLRRATHTLKGSGRMVGLSALGETAWELEQTLNLWLGQELAVTPELLAMLGAEQSLFTLWVAHLEGQGSAPDPAELIAQARQLRASPDDDALAEQAKLSAAAAALADLLAPDTGDAATPATPPPSGLRLATQDGQRLDNAGQPDEPAHDAPPAATPDPDTLEPLVPEAAPPLASGRPAITISPVLFEIFRNEARGHLDVLHDQLADIEQRPERPTPFAMTRAAHTLGGIAATVGLLPIHHLAIALEHALLRRDASSHAASDEALAIVHAVIERLEEMYRGLAEEHAPEEAHALLDALATLYPADSAAVRPFPSEAGEGDDDADTAPPADAPAAIVAQPDSPPAPAQPAAAPILPLPGSTLQDEIDEQLLPLFLAEAEEQLPALSRLLRQWRDNPAHSEPGRAIARLLHTFKGNARMCGALNLGEFSHQLESRVAEASRGLPDASLFDILESGCDTLQAGVDFLQAPPAATAATATTPLAAAQPPSATPASAGDAAETAAATLRVGADTVDRLVNDAGELAIARSRIEGEMRSLKSSLLDLTDNVIRLRRQLRDIEIEAETQMQSGGSQTPTADGPFDPLELDRFTRFQELTRFMAESVNDVATVQAQLLKNLDDANAALLAQARLNRELQQSLMGIRMVPFASLAERLYRITRQTAKSAGKRVHLDITGGQVELDRSVLAQMLGPLEHMLRNAVIHGIEDSEARQATGKPSQGEITLSVAQEGNDIVLTLADDGRGLDLARLRQSALGMGLISEEQSLDARQAAELIFQPGLSTAETLTQDAGRGIGMDVVRTELNALGGRISVDTTPGAGCRFTLTLPLTLAVTQALLVRIGEEVHALPSSMVEQVLDLREEQLNHLRHDGYTHWQGQDYPYHYLPALLGQANALPPTQRQYPVLLLRSGQERRAVLVDEIVGNQEVVVKNIGPQLARLPGISGATVLGNGRIVLILDPLSIESAAPAAAASTATASLPPPAPALLVVDDSLTVRKITSRLLERFGYRVILAKDGVEAMERVDEEVPAVILSDIEMPRMDGFELVRALRADRRTTTVPIIMITSRTADKHRNHALELGANHYLGKPYREEELLSLIADYLPPPA